MQCQYVPSYCRRAICACRNHCCVMQGVTCLHLVAAYGKVGYAAAILMQADGPVGGHAPEVSLLLQCYNQSHILSISDSRILCRSIALVDRAYLGSVDMIKQRPAISQTAACMQLAVLSVVACLEVM